MDFYRRLALEIRFRLMMDGRLASREEKRLIRDIEKRMRRRDVDIIITHPEREKLKEIGLRIHNSQGKTNPSLA